LKSEPDEGVRRAFGTVGCRGKRQPELRRHARLCGQGKSPFRSVIEMIEPKNGPLLEKGAKGKLSGIGLCKTPGSLTRLYSGIHPVLRSSGNPRERGGAKNFQKLALKKMSFEPRSRGLRIHASRIRNVDRRPRGFEAAKCQGRGSIHIASLLRLSKGRPHRTGY